MSNIYTEFARLVPRPGVRMGAAEVARIFARILGDRGSYWVPPWSSVAAGAWIDLVYGPGKGAGLHNLEAEELAGFEAIWVRFADEGADFDTIQEVGPDLGGGRRPCRYAFDEVRVVGASGAIERALPAEIAWTREGEVIRARCDGSYLALNERIDWAVGPGARLGAGRRSEGGLSTPSLPCHAGARAIEVEPAAIERLLAGREGWRARVDLLHAGRVVHRCVWGDQERRWCADDWDNCVDPDFAAWRELVGG